MLSQCKEWFGGVLLHTGFRKYFANTSWMFAEQVLRLVAELLVGIWVARQLGAAQFGTLSYVIAFVAIFGAIAKLGLDSIVVRNLVNDPSRKQQYLGTAFWLKIGGAVISFAVIVVALNFTSSDTTTRLYILIIAVGMIFQAAEVTAFYFQSQVQAKYVSYGKLVQLLLSVVLKVYFVLDDAELEWFVYVSLFDQISLAVAYSLIYRSQRIGNILGGFAPGLAKQLLRDSWPLIFSSLVVMIYMRIDQVMIKEMLGDKAVGIYSVAVRLSEVWYFIPMVITSSLLPSIINARRISKALYTVRLQRLYTAMVWVAIAIAIPTTMFSDQLVGFLYGSAYEGAGDVLKINAWAGVFVFLGVASSAWLTSESLQRLDFYRTFSGATINILLNLELIPLFGISGAAMATLASYMTAGFLFDMFNKRMREVFIMKVNAFLFRGLVNGN